MSAARPVRLEGPSTVKISLTASAALASVSMPVTIAFYPPAAIPAAIAAVALGAIVVWHLRRGGRAMLKRSPKGQITFTLDSVPKRR